VTQTISDALHTATLLLERTSASARLDAELLLEYVTGLSRTDFRAAPERALPAAAGWSFQQLIRRRLQGEPVAYIRGQQEFWSLLLEVSPAVLIPRPETELVVERTLALLRPDAKEMADLGTGSGAIALSLATEVPHARVFAAENSVDAFIWTRENFAGVGADNATLAFIDLEHAFPELDGTVSVVVSNPPYVPDAAIPRDPEVRFFDPPAALYGGEDGLDVVRILSGVGLRLAHPGGVIVIEHGEWQGEAIRALLAADGWRAAATHPDLTLRDRATTAIRP